MRRSAKLLGVNKNTIASRMRFLAEQAKLNHLKFQTKHSKAYLQFCSIQFDEMKSSEHTKCKPLSIALAVDNLKRKILAVEVSEIPADGHLAEIARKKYGKRENNRERGLARMFKSLKPIVATQAEIMSDSWTTYSIHVNHTFPDAKYLQVLSRKGSIVGQGELKKVGFDPLFSLNHTAAMIRANVNRLFRRTWCTTKKKERLLDHLMIYVDFHNRVLTG